LFGISAIPRIAAFFLLSYAVAPGWKWLSQWRKIDVLLVNAIGSKVSYAFTLQARASDAGESLASTWYVVEIILHWLVLFSLIGHLRIMFKWFPWSQRAIFIYKLVRFYNAIYFLCIHLVGSGTRFIDSSTLAFFEVTISLYNHLFQEATKREHSLREELKEKNHRSSRDVHLSTPLLK
jgi:hypothetical protein